MRRTSNNVYAALLCAACWGTAAQASAQEPAQTAPVAESQNEQAPASPEAPAAQSSPSAGPTALPETVPAYELKNYQLTPPGAAAGRSETLRWPNRPLLGTSALMFTAAYVPAVLTAAFREEDTTDNLYIPVAGPWLELAQEEQNTANKALLAVSGVFQGLGALGMVTSLLVPERRTSRWFLIGNKRFAVSPAASRLAYGVSASGRF